MTTKTKTSAAKIAALPATTTHRQPTHRLYRVNGDGDAATWTPIGAAWPNKDGNGFNISCDAIPLQGRIVLRRIEPKADAGAIA